MHNQILDSEQQIESTRARKENAALATHLKSAADDSSPQKENVAAKAVIDIENDRFPNSIVWTTLPCVSCVCPCIGHMGIGDSRGVIHDFAGSYFIGVDDFAFGRPLKYVKLDTQGIKPELFDMAIQQSDNRFCRMTHNICCNNCHSHVAEVLNNIEYGGRKDWSMFKIWWLSVCRSRYVSCSGILKTYLGFLVLLIVIASLAYLIVHLVQRENF